MRPVFHFFGVKKNSRFFLKKNILATALKSYIKWLLHFFFFFKSFKKLKKLVLCPQIFCFGFFHLLLSAFIFFYRITKMKIKSFECPKSIKNYEKKNTLNVRCLVDQSFVPSAQRTSILYCRLSDFRLV